jgi:uncharacterized membrane protein YjgN (DUF898 family)
MNGSQWCQIAADIQIVGLCHFSNRCCDFVNHAQKYRLFPESTRHGKLAAMRDSPTAPGQAIQIQYAPRPGLGSLAIINFLLTIFTLGIYRFWAKTNVRKHIWSCIYFNGQPLEYTGRGLELFLGFLIVLGIFILPFILLVFYISLAYGPEHPAIIALQLLLYLIIAVLWGAALYRARRYQLSRTLWRGIRGTLAGSSMIYSLTYFGSLLASGMSLGWSNPVLNTVLQEQIIGDMRFGSLAFKFRGRAGPLYPTYALCWFLTLVAILAGVGVIAFELAALTGPELSAAFANVFGDNTEPTPVETWTVATAIIAVGLTYLAVFLVIPMLWAIYTAKELATFASYTTAGNATFKLNATAGSLISLVIVNMLILIFTLGIGRPFIQQRLVRYMCDRLQVIGTVDVDGIIQSSAALSKTGEGLADAFDVSVI